MKKITLLIVSIMLLTGCSSDKGTATAPIIKFGDVSITIGESVPTDLSSQGFEVTLGANKIVNIIDANTWLMDAIFVYKDSETYGYLYVYNPSETSVPTMSGTIYKVKIKIPDDNENSAWHDMYINDICFNGMDSSAVKEAMSEYELSAEVDIKTKIYDKYKDGDYTYTINYNVETGLVESVEVEMYISKDYS